MSFESALQNTIDLEGGFDDDRNDSGNWTGGDVGKGELKGTKFGVSAAQYPNENIRDLTIERAREIYHRDYWEPLGLTWIQDEEIQEEVFDTAVNMGQGTAARILQEAVNFLEIGEPLDIDGVIGSQTLSYANKWCKKDSEVFFKVLNGLQFMRYYAIAKSSSKERFAYGWMKRIQQWRSEA